MIQNNSFPKVIFFGTPDFAVESLDAILNASIPVLAVVTTPDKPAGRGRKIQTSAIKDFAVEKNLPVLQPENLKDADFLKELSSYNADLFIVVAFRMLPEVVWNMPPLGTINAHASLLPKYRGAAPIHWAIINGETETGVTTFQLRQEIDTGPLLLQEKIKISKEDTLETLYNKLKIVAGTILVKTINGIANNSISSKEQEWTKDLPLAPKVDRNTGKIDWNKKSEEIYNLIRGLNPFPTATCDFEGEVMKVFKSSFSLDKEKNFEIGSMDTDKKSYIRFRTRDGWLNILEAQLAGKRRMDIKDLLRGYRWKD